ncbi:MAG: PEGA domain-containing protein, partial [Myxococcales bacterium]
DIILKHLHEAPVPPRDVRPDLSIAQELSDVVVRCMAKAREERFQSMDELLAQLKAVRTKVTGVMGPSSSPPPYDTSPNLHPVSGALAAQTPPHSQPSMQTPSQPMPTLKTPAAGTRRALHHPPPPPPDALYEDERNIQEISTPAYGTSMPKKRAPRWAMVAAAASVVVTAGISFKLYRSAQPTIVVEKLPLAPPPVVAATTPVPPAPAPAAAPAPAEPPSPYQTANTGTTLVTVSSTPSGAEVRDVDDRLLGMTPFDLRVPAAKPLQLTLRHEGFKPVTLKRKPEGERISLSVTMKKDAKADPYEAMPNKRSVGYKDDPY